MVYSILDTTSLFKAICQFISLSFYILLIMYFQHVIVDRSGRKETAWKKQYPKFRHYVSESLRGETNIRLREHNVIFTMRLKIILFIVGHKQDSTNDGVADHPSYLHT